MDSDKGHLANNFRLLTDFILGTQPFLAGLPIFFISLFFGFRKPL
jgi:hypothetical protein